MTRSNIPSQQPFNIGPNHPNKYILRPNRKAEKRLNARKADYGRLSPNVLPGAYHFPGSWNK
jgi:hypothetical protein